MGDCIFTQLSGFIRWTKESLETLSLRVLDQEHEIDSLRKQLGQSSRRKRKTPKYHDVIPQTGKQEEQGSSSRPPWFHSDDEEDASIHLIHRALEMGETHPNTEEARCGRRNVDDIRCIYTLTGHDRGVTALDVSSDELFSGSHDCTIKVLSQ